MGQQAKRELVIRTASPIVALPAISSRVPISSTRDTMRKSATWWGKHPEKLDSMNKIPVRTVAKKRRAAPAPKKVAAKPKPQSKTTPAKATNASAATQKDLGRKAYDKGTVNKRLVERALGRYQKR